MKYNRCKDAKTAANRVMKRLSKHSKWSWVATARHPQPSIFLAAAKHWAFFINGQITTQQYTAKILITEAQQRKNAYAVHTAIVWDELPGRWHALVGRHTKVFVEKKLLIGLEAAERWLEDEIKRHHVHALRHELQELKEGPLKQEDKMTPQQIPQQIPRQISKILKTTNNHATQDNDNHYILITIPKDKTTPVARRRRNKHETRTE